VSGSIAGGTTACWVQGAEIFAGSILSCAAAWLPHQAERVTVGEEDDRLVFPPRCEAAGGIGTPSYDWLHILESLGYQFCRNDSDKG